jgi:predicted enzyme related to lactoylglutathione lyase
MSKHPIVHVEISANDREGAGKFYEELFGWNIQQIPEMNYATFDYGVGGVGGGLNPVREDNPAGTVVVYVDTDDINADLAKIENLGGKIVTPKTEIPGMGWFGIFTDPTGNLIGLYTAIPRST